MKQYGYMVIRFNHPDYERKSTLLHNDYKKSKRYAIFNYSAHKDGSESLNFIEYSDDLEDLHNRAKDYPTWFNYPIGLFKPIDGEIQPIP